MKSSDHNNMDSDANEQEPNGMEDVSSSVSRRKFLTFLGAASLGALAASVPIPAALGKELRGSKADIDLAARIGASSALLNTSLSELMGMGFAFDVSQATFRRMPEQPDNLTMVLQSARIPGSFSSAEIFQTINLATQQVLAVQYVSAQVNQATSDFQRVTLFSDGTRQVDTNSLSNDPVVTKVERHAEDSPDSCTPYSYLQCCCWSYVGCSRTASCRNSQGNCITLCVEVYQIGTCQYCTRNYDCSTSCTTAGNQNACTYQGGTGCGRFVPYGSCTPC
jgi:biotin operon repressor